MPHVVALPIVFALFYDRDGQGGVFKIVKNVNFLSTFGRLGPFH